jgi:hypothetical protein
MVASSLACPARDRSGIAGYQAPTARTLVTWGLLALDDADAAGAGAEDKLDRERSGQP